MHSKIIISWIFQKNNRDFTSKESVLHSQIYFQNFIREIKLRTILFVWRREHFAHSLQTKVNLIQKRKCKIARKDISNYGYFEKQNSSQNFREE